MNTNFTKQTATKPAFDDLLWSRPERLPASGKLTVIGGNLHQFALTQIAFISAQKFGIGKAKVILPDKLKKTIGQMEDIEFAASTKSGSFASESKPELQAAVQWSDGLLLPGELTNNSQTEILISELVESSTKPVVVGPDAIESILKTLPLHEQKIILILEKQQVQLITKYLKLPFTVTSATTLDQLRNLLSELSIATAASIIYVDETKTLVVADGQMSQSDAKPNKLDALRIASAAAVLMIQFPKKLFEALTTAVYMSVTEEI